MNSIDIQTRAHKSLLRDLKIIVRGAKRWSQYDTTYSFYPHRLPIVKDIRHLIPYKTKLEHRKDAGYYKLTIFVEEPLT